jgi:gamma-glutamyl-gamma-aminobutyrate hydrolase PuuD
MATPHATFDVAERPTRSKSIVRRALDADLLVLAICRGLQILNARCGTLIRTSRGARPLLPHDTEGPTTPAPSLALARAWPRSSAPMTFAP